MLKIGNITLDVPFYQAPLSGYSDYAMRKLARDNGAPLTFAGVLLAKSAANPKVLAKKEFRPRSDEHPIGVQLLGEDPQIMAIAAKALQETGYDIVDLNFACPAPKVLRRQRGGYLINDPEKVIEIFRRVRDAVTCPVMMKLRTGFDNSQASRDNFWKIFSQASAENIDAVAVHGRSVVQKFRGTADWKILAELKEKFPKTTIIGSGDLFDPCTIIDLLKSTGIDGVVIARGAIGNPWIFRELRARLNGSPTPDKPSLLEKGQTILEHFRMVTELYNVKKAVGYMRKFAGGYCKHHPERRKVLKAIFSAANQDELLAAVQQWYGVN